MQSWRDRTTQGAVAILGISFLGQQLGRTLGRQLGRTLGRTPWPTTWPFFALMSMRFLSVQKWADKSAENMCRAAKRIGRHIGGQIGRQISRKSADTSADNSANESADIRRGCVWLARAFWQATNPTCSFWWSNSSDGPSQ